MRSRLRVFALVGLIVTAIDLGIYLLVIDRGRNGAPLTELSSRWIALSVVASVAVSAFVSYVANRTITFRNTRAARWVRSPVAFAATAVIAGSVDMLATVLFVRLGVTAFSDNGLLARCFGIFSALIVRWVVYRRVLFTEVRRDLAERVNRPPSPGDVRLTVVVPAYEAADEIRYTVTSLSKTLTPVVGEGQLEVLVVDDGSVDDTGPVAEAAGARVVVHPQNRGKGAAVRTGVLAARGKSVVFTDADLSYSPEHVVTFLAELEAGWDVVVGSRRHEETTTLVRARKIRELGGRAINWLTHLVLLGHFRDTQCGIKGFRGDIGKVIFERTTIDGFAFDVEIYLLAEQDQLSLLEVPVSVENRAVSSVRIVSDTAKLVRDLVRVRRMAGWGRYRPSPAQLAVIESSAEEPTVPETVAESPSGAEFDADTGSGAGGERRIADRRRPS